MIPLQSSATMTIVLSDVNDNQPRFNASYFVAYVEENIEPQSRITRYVTRSVFLVNSFSSFSSE